MWMEKEGVCCNLSNKKEEKKKKCIYNKCIAKGEKYHHYTSYTKWKLDPKNWVKKLTITKKKVDSNALDRSDSVFLYLSHTVASATMYTMIQEHIFFS